MTLDEAGLLECSDHAVHRLRCDERVARQLRRAHVVVLLEHRQRGVLGHGDAPGAQSHVHPRADRRLELLDEVEQSRRGNVVSASRHDDTLSLPLAHRRASRRSSRSGSVRSAALNRRAAATAAPPMSCRDHTASIGISRCRMFAAARCPEYSAAVTVAGSSVQVASPAMCSTPPTGVARTSWSAVVEPTVM